MRVEVPHESVTRIEGGSGLRRYYESLGFAEVGHRLGAPLATLLHTFEETVKQACQTKSLSVSNE